MSLKTLLSLVDDIPTLQLLAKAKSLMDATTVENATAESLQPLAEMMGMNMDVEFVNLALERIRGLATDPAQSLLAFAKNGGWRDLLQSMTGQEVSKPQNEHGMGRCPHCSGLVFPPA